MDEFEPFRATEGDNMLHDGRILPDDFEVEDTAFAHMLNETFDIQREMLPPRYAQTLLMSKQDILDEEYEQRICSAVFQKLHLEHPVQTCPPSDHEVQFKPQFLSQTSQQHNIALNIFKKSALIVMALLVLFSFNAMTSGNAFASVLQFIVGRGGAEMVKSYPKPTTISTTSKTTTQQADHHLLYTPMWAGSTVDGYTFLGLDLFDAQWWTNGVIITLRYEKTDATGRHRLTLLEFVPRDQIALQVVKTGSAQTVQIGTNSAIFVTGHWVHINGTIVWEPDQRAELISGTIGGSGLVTWIAADDLPSNTDINTIRDMLISVAQQLQPFTLGDLSGTVDGIRYAGKTVSVGPDQPFFDDVIALVPNRSDVAASTIYIRLGSLPSNAGPTNSGPNLQPQR